jgi:S-adenosylmethionine uptake transporter
VGLLLAVGVSATLAQLAMTRAYGKGRTLLAANLQFSAIVFAALLGTMLFGDRIAFTGWLGIGIIVASCIGATALVARAARRPILDPNVATADQ